MPSPMQKLLTLRPTASRAAVLLLFGLAVGYPSVQILGHSMWGGGPGPILTSIALLAFFAAAAAFLTAAISFVTISVQTLFSSAATPSGNYPPTPLALQSIVLAIVVFGLAQRAAFKDAPFVREYWRFTMIPYLVAQVPI